MMATAQDVLEQWFTDRARKLWFERDLGFDEELRVQFADTLDAAACGKLAAWENDPDGCLALVIALDQLTRNLHRGTPCAFAHDARAVAVAERAIGRGLDEQVTLDRRRFYYLPFERSEQLAAPAPCIELFERWTDAHRDGGTADADAKDELRYTRRHCETLGKTS